LLTLTELQEIDSDVVVIGVDADPNEEAQQVINHVEENGFEGRYIVAPQELTDALVDEFGPSILSPPTSPVVLISADQSSARLLPRGLKSLEDIQSELEAEQ
jgi:hypothetical protein